MLTDIYCRFTIIGYTTQSFLSLKCVYIFLADPVYVCINIFFFRNVKFGLSMGKNKLKFMHESHKCVYILRTLKFLIFLVMVLNFCANSVIYL